MTLILKIIYFNVLIILFIFSSVSNNILTNLSDMADTEFEEVPEELSFIASVRFEGIPLIAGSLITNEYVMTLANILDATSERGTIRSELSCRIGEYMTNVDGIGIPVESVLIPPFYNYSVTVGNIALLKLAHEVVAYQPVNLPEEYLQYGSNCKIVGWSERILNGTIIPKRKLVIINVMLADVQECSHIMLDLSHSVIQNIPVNTLFNSEFHICVKTDRVKTPNLEDIGSLLMCNGVQYGIIVFKLYENNYNITQHYYWLSIRLDKILEWIHEILSNYNPEILYADNIEL